MTLADLGVGVAVFVLAAGPDPALFVTLAALAVPAVLAVAAFLFVLMEIIRHASRTP